MISSKPPLLVVEDSLEDMEALTRTLRKLGISVRIEHCSDADSALDYLHRRGAYSDPKRSPRPALILLDLNLLGRDGREVLTHVKSDEGLRSIPVVVLSTSSSQKDVEQCYQLGANSYQVKPVDIDELSRSTRVTMEYWLSVALVCGRECPV